MAVEKKVALYDFDKTIFRKDSSNAFFWFCLNKKPYHFLFLFKLLFWVIILIFRGISLTKFKEKSFSFVKWFDNIDIVVDEFWLKQETKINKWYLKQKKDNDVVCTASPEFLVGAIINKINPRATLIGTKLDKRTAKITGENCKGKEKVARLKQLGMQKFDSAYSDSLSDIPILGLAKNKYIVRGERLFIFNEHSQNRGEEVLKKR